MLNVKDLVTGTLRNDSVFTTFIHPEKVVVCRQISPSSLLLFLPVFLQCALLYPGLENLRWPRPIRRIIMPFSVYFGIKFAVDFCFKPRHERAFWNLGVASTGMYMAMKAVEWGSVKDSVDGKLWRRPQFQFETEHLFSTADQPDSQATVKENVSKSYFSFRDWYVWTAEHFSSVRGIQYGWGVNAAPSTLTALDIFLRMYKVNLVHVIALAFSILCRDAGSAMNALRRLGIPSFPGSTIAAEGLCTLAFGFYLVSITDLTYSYLSLFAHIINALHHHRYVRFPAWFMEFYDLRLFVPIYDSPHLTTTLAHLWGKAWHQAFRRGFLICGGIPASKLVKKAGMGVHLQRLAGLFGTFFASGILHELAIHFVAREPHPTRHVFYFREFPGSFFFFMIQPIGILLEPYIIPYIPGGGMVWCYLFILVTATPFRIQYFQGYRMLDYSYPQVSLGWLVRSIVVPGITSWGWLLFP